MSGNNYTQIGKSVPRRDGVDKVTGRGLFTSDMYLPGMLFAKILRSPPAHARIVRINTSKAAAMPGVRAIATHENTPGKLYNASAAMFTTVPGAHRELDQRIFDTVMRYVGDEVAAVAADTLAQAEAAVQAIEVEYEILPHVLDPFAAMDKSAPELHPGKHTTPEKYNVPGAITRLYWGIEPGADEGTQAVEAALAGCDIVLEDTFTVPVVKQVQLETMCAVAKFDGDGSVTVWSTSQTPHPARFILAHIFDMPASKVRVLSPPYLGGGFGVRIGLSAKAEPIAIALAKLAGRPVRVEFTREEDFTATDTRHGGSVHVRLGAKHDGTLQVLDLGIVLATGAYCTFGVELPAVAGAMTLAIYDMPVKRYIGHSVYTNQTTAGAMRGFGNPQGNFAMEQMMDRLAQKLGMDPLALRKKNIMKAGNPWFLPFPCSSSALEDCIDKGATSIGWHNRNSFDNSGLVKRGLGMAVGTHVSNGWPFCVDYDNAYFTVQVDGSVHLAAAVPDMGTGTSTSLPQVAAEAFGVPLAAMHFAYADTATAPFSIGSHASRALFAMGLAVKQAAEDARSQVLAYAAAALHKEVNCLNLKDGMVVVEEKNTPITLHDAEQGKAGAFPLSELCYHAHIRNKQFIGLGRTVPPNSPPWHACFADVSVDTETGMVTVNKMASAHDVGFVVNPMIVEGQIEGGVVQGIGYALTEEITYNASGRQNHRNMHSYMVPTIDDIPPIDSIMVTAADPQGPYGAKGAGECSLVCPASAIANAVVNALGIPMPALPMTPERILAALRK